MKAFAIAILYVFASNLLTFCQDLDPDYTEFLTQNQLIYEFIFENYEKDVAPVHDEKNDSIPARECLKANGNMSSIQVLFQLVNGSFLQLDQASQTVHVQLEFNVEWMDPRLAWDPANFADINYLYVRRSQIWIPDFTIRNSEKTKESLPEETQYSYITYFGLVSSFYNFVVRQPCSLKLEKFPFDTQTCTFWIYSNSAGPDDIFAENRIIDGLDAGTWGNGEWNVINVSVQDLLVYEGDKENEMQVGQYSIVIKRTTAYYVTIILIPCFLCTLIIIIGLFMADPVELIGKLTIGLTGIMALVFLMGLAANSLPRTASVPNMTVFILTCLIHVVSSLLYVLIFPNDPFTIKLAAVSQRHYKDKESRAAPSRCWRLVSVHNILCVCITLATFIHLMILIN